MLITEKHYLRIYTSSDFSLVWARTNYASHLYFNCFSWRDSERVYWLRRFIIYVALLHSSSWSHRWNEYYHLVGFGGCYFYCEKSYQILTKKNNSFLQRRALHWRFYGFEFSRIDLQHKSINSIFIKLSTFNPKRFP